MTRRVLLISASQVPASIGILRHLASSLVSEGARVDAFDTYPAIGSHVGYLTPRDRVYEATARKYRRFVRPVINGRDLTRTVDLSDVNVPPLPATVDELRSQVSDGAKVGLAALSLTATYTKIASRGQVSDYGVSLRRNWNAAHLAAEAARQLAGRHDEVYVFNGRTATSRPFCDVLEHWARVFRYEVGGAPDSHLLFDGPVHDAKQIVQRIREHSTDRAAGIAYFEKNRARSADAMSTRFSGGQQVGHLPRTLEGRKVVSFFTSSEDEYFATSDQARYGEFDTQFDAAMAVAEICRERGDLLVVRLHPHLMRKDESWAAVWDFNALQATGALVLRPEDEADSYALVDRSRAVITCGSTVGIEGAYAGVPSLMIGERFATLMGICTPGRAAQDLADFLRDPAPLPGARDQAITLGSYRTTSGRPVPGLLDGQSVNQARIDGRLIDPMRHWVSRLRGLVPL